MRSFLGYAMSPQIDDESRSMEKVIDTICGVVLPPVVGGIGQVVLDTETIGGVEGFGAAPSETAWWSPTTIPTPSRCGPRFCTSTAVDISRRRR